MSSGEVSKELQEVYDTHGGWYKKGLGAELSTKAYDKAASKYEELAALVQFTGPEKAAETMIEMFPEESQREKLRVLDVGAGTGQAGRELHKVGFRTLDALEPSSGMLAEAKKKGIYKNFYNEYMSDKKLPIDDNTYDVIVTSGAMGENHIPCSAFHEMIRIVKPGGHIVNVTHMQHLETCPEYIGRFEPLMEELEKDGKWKEVRRIPFPGYTRDDDDGIVLIHQIL